MIGILSYVFRNSLVFNQNVLKKEDTFSGQGHVPLNSTILKAHLKPNEGIYTSVDQNHNPHVAFQFSKLFSKQFTIKMEVHMRRQVFIREICLEIMIKSRYGI